jgi:isopenicillin-N N-acyltransferase like protein
VECENSGFTKNKCITALPFLKRVGRLNVWSQAATAAKIMLLKTSADHRAELQAMIKTSGLDAESIVVANTMLELRRMGGCSTLIVEKEKSKTGEVLFGRNFDFPPMDRLDRYGIVTIYKPKGKRKFVSVGYPGLTGTISGMNDAGLCVATLDVYATKDDSPRFDFGGAPMMFTFRRILEECKTVKEAEALLKKHKATTWMNLSVCDVNGGVVFEITPKNVIVRRPVAGCVSCTNHFRSAELSPSRECDRFHKLMKSREAKSLGVADVARHLHEVHQGKMTIQTMIFEPASLKLHVSLTNPPTTARTLKTLDVGKLFERDDVSTK